ncbi:hypothetical protein K788_0002371 [Paraburkholderia caribensis MBA4]|uniref:Uncharacterized protein n=1 Tax=Paraburkholderia caribensis MBA4 TaxID=1323664 RepID=A0A0P0R953_9BURK|nr:hypothetical protein K788_0002371 [Paraburkholderia caribensis MBA4]
MRAPGESEAGGSRRGRHIMSAIAVHDKAQPGGRVANLVQREPVAGAGHRAFPGGVPSD